MSNNAKKALAKLEHALLNGEPLPLDVGQKKNPTPGNGRATFKTATAAANAARAARDEAKKSETVCIQYAKMCGDFVDKDIENTRELLAALQRNEKILIWCASISLAGFIGALITALIFA